MSTERKTDRQVLLEAYAESQKLVFGNDSGERHNLVKAFHVANEMQDIIGIHLEENPEPVMESLWIPVSERLPKDMEDVLFCEPQDGIQLTYFDSQYLRGPAFMDQTIEEWLLVIHFPQAHWMPLPSPPSNQSDNGKD